MENAIIEFLDNVLVIDSNVVSNFANIDSKMEDGGVLFGYKLFDKNEYVISGKTSKQIDDSYTYFTFGRNSSKHLEIINEKWVIDNSTMYLGDWHFHPVDSVEPSNTDLDTFKKICKYCKSSSKYLFFIIVSKNEFVVYIYNKRKRKKIHEEKVFFNK